MPYEHLLAPGRIGTLELRNRILMAPMGEELAAEDGSVSEEQHAYVEARAAGGAALVTLGSVAVAWPLGTANERQNGITRPEHLAGLRRLADTAHHHGARIALQLSHMGKVARNDIVAGRPMWVPSMPGKPHFDPLIAMLTDDEMAKSLAPMQAPTARVEFHEMTTDDIATVVDWFASAVVAARDCGIDAIELHAGHGYLLDEFLSPASNRRTDDYGGPLVHRARLLLEVIGEIRARVGRDYPLWARVNAVEFFTDGGEQLADLLALAPMLEAAGLDAIHVSAYGDPNMALSFTESHTAHTPEQLVPFARAVKAVVDIPVIAVGRIAPEAAEALLADGGADFVTMGRRLLADPELPNLLRADHGDDARPCAYHYRCIGNIFLREGVRCAVNPQVGRETALAITPTATPQRVLVAGGGPAGLEAARVAALRGHDVVLAEASDRLGGRLTLAARTYGPNADLHAWLCAQPERVGVTVRRNTPVDAALLAEVRPDVVIDATGGRWQRPTVPGADAPHVLDLDAATPWVLGERTLASGPVVVVGGGRAGCGLALLARQQGHEVTLVEAGTVLATQFGMPGRWRHVHELREAGVVTELGAELVAIEPEQIVVRQAGAERTLAAATVVTVATVAPNDAITELVAALGIPVHRVGDCTGPRFLEGSLLDATTVAVGI